MKLDLRLLGGFALALDRDGGRQVRIRSPKGCALVAYLAMHPARSASRERLADLLWSDRFDDRARQNLRQCLVRLRADLAGIGAEVLVHDQDGVGLHGDDLTVDALQFVALAESADAARQKQAIELYRGEFLADLHLDVEGFDQWVRGERIRLAGIATRLSESFAVHAARLGMGEAAISAAERLIAIDPLREDWQRLVLQLYARHRGREAALDHAQAVTAQLKHELGAAPAAATSALIEKIKREAVAAVPVTLSRELEPAADRVSTDQEPAGHDRSAEKVPVGSTATVAGDGSARPPGWTTVSVRRRFGWPMAGLTGVAVAILISAWAVQFLPGSAPPTTPNGIHLGPAIDGAGLAAKGLYSVIVLPFTAGASDSGPERALADQITDDLINDLSRTGGPLRVISRQTSGLYRHLPIDIAAVGAELGARYAVVGSIRGDDLRVQINVELVDASSRVQVWTSRMEREKSELPVAIGEIAWGITRQLHVAVVMAEDHRDPGGSSHDPVTGELLAKGWSVIFRHNVTATTAAAEDYFTEALRRDPENLSATIGLAAHYVISVSNLYVLDSEPYLSRAHELLTKAIDKNPHSPQAYYFLGILQKVRNQPEAALRSFTTALELSPSNAPACAQIGSVLASLGRANEAMDHVQRAIRLSPQDPALGRWELFAGQIEIELEHDQAAIEWLSQAITLNPRNLRVHAFLAAAYALDGNTAAAARQILELEKLAPWVIDQSDKLFNGYWGVRANGQVPRYVRGWQMAIAAASAAGPEEMTSAESSRSHPR